jgi:cytochrome c oxidase subunit 2
VPTRLDPTPEEPMSSTPRRRLAPEAVIAAVVVILLAVLVPLVVYSRVGDSLFPPNAVTTQAKDVRILYNIVFGIAVAIFVAVEGLIVWSVIRYRRKAGDDELPPQTHGNSLIEIIWTLIPTVIVLYLFAISYQTLSTVDAVSDTPDIRIHAVAQQFQWQFTYLDANGNKVATQTAPLASDGGGMGVPVGKNVLVTLDSPDVIHAFYVPRFLFKRDVVPGQTNRFQFTIDPSEATDGHPEVLGGQCAELCGTGHRTMLFNVVAMSPADYDAWLQALIVKANASPPPQPSVGAGATVLKVTAKDIAFDTKTLEVPANQGFSIDFTNNDVAGTLHNIEIRGAEGSIIADPPTIDGGQSTNYTYAPLGPGTYTFICKIHPIASMTGTLTVH